MRVISQVFESDINKRITIKPIWKTHSYHTINDSVEKDIHEIA